MQNLTTALKSRGYYFNDANLVRSRVEAEDDVLTVTLLRHLDIHGFYTRQSDSRNGTQMWVARVNSPRERFSPSEASSSVFLTFLFLLFSSSILFLHRENVNYWKSSWGALPLLRTPSLASFDDCLLFGCYFSCKLDFLLYSVMSIMFKWSCFISPFVYSIFYDVLRNELKLQNVRIRVHDNIE